MNPLFYLADTLIFIGIFALLSLSLNLEFGLAGLGNFGKVAFFMAGAYAYTLLAHASLPFYLCLLGGIVVAGILGIAVTLPALRLREDYLAIVTLAFGEILRTIVKAQENLAGGVRGITVPRIFHLGSFRADTIANIELTLSCLILCFLVVQALAHSPYGRVLRAIREDEVAVKALGKNPVFFKATVLFIGSSIAGLAGGVFAQYINFIDPSMFLPSVTFLVWMMLILGGAGNCWGAMLGALVVELMNRGTRIMKDFITLPVDPNNLQYIFFGLIVILILLFRPQGILPEGPIQTAARKEAKQWISSSSTE
ncbi:branched-chain amino acid ABC transporter permease [Desulfothermobacter acidiphilus]|uniref:branched-chain amino acid ABC transporter permease n=1 Tax=Desulfothermobacter acidiphilus TaxID=1938353 RepID=UPI003F8CE915